MQPQFTPSSRHRQYIGFAAAIAVLVIIVSVVWYVGPGSTEVTQGTIGPVKKYGATQMSERDIRLRNAILSDRNALTAAIDQLRLLKVFAQRVSSDLTAWGDELTAVVARVQLKVEKRGLSVDQKIRDFRSYAEFIAFNGPVLDTTLIMLTRFRDEDTLADGFEVERVLNDFENFRVKFSEKFQNTMIGIPDLHNTLVRNGLNSVFFSSESGLGILLSTSNGTRILSKDELISGSQELQCCYSIPSMGANQQVIGSWTFGSGAMGYVASSQSAIGSSILGTGALGQTVTNATQLGAL